jgi:hypothetical protein
MKARPRITIAAICRTTAEQYVFSWYAPLRKENPPLSELNKGRIAPVKGSKFYWPGGKNLFTDEKKYRSDSHE